MPKTKKHEYGYVYYIGKDGYVWRDWRKLPKRNTRVLKRDCA